MLNILHLLLNLLFGCCIIDVLIIKQGDFLMKVLVVNAGSSSLKYQLFDTVSGSVLAKGNCERIGIDGSRVIHKTAGKGELVREQALADHSEATKVVVEMLLDAELGCIKSVDEIEAIGHRVVHGGPFFTESVLVTDEVLDVLSKCVSYACLRGDLCELYCF
jgi:acetate kinase